MFAVISWYLTRSHSFFPQEFEDIGKWSYLRILQDARLIAVKKQNVESYSIKQLNCDRNDKTVKQDVKKVYHTTPTHLICMRLASMLQGARGVTGTGMPCFYGQTEKDVTIQTVAPEG